MSQGPDIGQTYVLQSVVDPTRTALALATNGEALPDVFATPFMIADMERACATILHPYLKDGEVSVGARIEVFHTAPTPVGSQVTATATFAAREGALYWFDVVAEDSVDGSRRFSCGDADGGRPRKASWRLSRDCRCCPLQRSECPDSAEASLAGGLDFFSAGDHRPATCRLRTAVRPGA